MAHIKKKQKEMLRMRALLLAFLRFRDAYKNKDPDVDANLRLAEIFICQAYDLIEDQNLDEIPALDPDDYEDDYESEETDYYDYD